MITAIIVAEIIVTNSTIRIAIPVEFKIEKALVRDTTEAEIQKNRAQFTLSPERRQLTNVVKIVFVILFCD